jgi:hypothetical protein
MNFLNCNTNLDNQDPAAEEEPADEETAEEAAEEAADEAED